MIMVSRRNGTRFALNPDLIERVEETPDTVVTLVGGTKYVVAETLEQLVAEVREHKACVMQLAEARQAAEPDLESEADVPLQLVPGDG